MPARTSQQFTVSRNLRWLTPVVVAMFIAPVSCGGGSDESASGRIDVVPSSTHQVIQVIAVPSPTTTPAPSPTIPVVVERSADEQALYTLWESKREIVFSKQWERFRDGCPLAVRDADTRSAAEIEADYRAALARGGLVLEQMSFGEPKISIIGDSTALVEFTIFQDGEERFPWADFFSKSENGVWYSVCS
ncbi:MAG: hypothetical protein O3B95_06865 [Chloroflexi bacterium]|nr:hypothetical protein [Chloroflexota bacterium]